MRVIVKDEDGDRWAIDPSQIATIRTEVEDHSLHFVYKNSGGTDRIDFTDEIDMQDAFDIITAGMDQ